MAALHCVISKCRGTGSSGARHFWWQQWDRLEEKDPFRRKGLIGSKGSFQNGKRKQNNAQERRESKG